MGTDQRFKGNFVKLSIDYEESIKWLSNYLNIAKQTRLGKYIEILRQLKQFEVNSRFNLMNSLCNPEDVSFRAAFFEAFEIIEVCKSLKFVSSTMIIPENTIKKLKSGLVSYSEKNASDPSRDVFFELFIAARLIQNGVEIELTKDKADIIANFEDYKIFIECKRVQSENKLLVRLKEGVNQLENRYTKGKSREVGLVFLCIDKIINPSLDLIPVTGMSEMEHHLRENLKYYCNVDFTKRLINKIGMPRNKTLAYFVEATGVYNLMVSNSPGICHQTYYSSFFTKRNTPYFELFQKIEHKFVINRTFLDRTYAEEKEQ